VLLGIAAIAGDLSVHIKGLKTQKGQVLLSLFADAEGFPSDFRNALRAHKVEIHTNSVLIVITNVPPGTYALAVCHDENSDDQMNRRAFGPPKEGYAVFKPQKARFGPPKFENSAFDVSTNDLDIEITLTYPGD